MKILIFILMIINSIESQGALTCSANGLKVIYINGINVKSSTSADKARSTIFDIINKDQKSFDSNKLANTILVHNESLGLLEDIEELKVEMAVNHGCSNNNSNNTQTNNCVTREDYWNAMAKNKLDSSLTVDQKKKKVKEINERISKFLNKTEVKYENGSPPTQSTYTKTQEFQDELKLNKEIAYLVAIAESDINVVLQLKKEIKDAYDDGKNKVIVVAHSQGNEVLFSALKDLRSEINLSDDEDNTKLKKFDSLVGYLQVAPPSPRSVTDTENTNGEIRNFNTNHSQYILSDEDIVINLLSYIFTGRSSLSSNYRSNDFVTFWNNLKNFNVIDTVLSMVGQYGGTTLFHGMDDVYLSDTFSATRMETNKETTFKEHFTDNLREIASKLESNCTLEIRTADTHTTIDQTDKSVYYNYPIGYNKKLKLETNLNANYDNSKIQYRWIFNGGDLTFETKDINFPLKPGGGDNGSLQLQILDTDNNILARTYYKYKIQTRFQCTALTTYSLSHQFPSEWTGGHYYPSFTTSYAAIAPVFIPNYSYGITLKDCTSYNGLDANGNPSFSGCKSSDSVVGTTATSVNLVACQNSFEDGPAQIVPCSDFYYSNGQFSSGWYNKYCASDN